MITIFAHIIFALGVYCWLAWEYKKPLKPFLYWQWLVLNVFFSIVGVVLAQTSPTGLGWGNVFLHAIGGGMATTATFIYLKKSLNWNPNFRIEAVVLFMLVSTFGVLNELYEYAADLAGLGQFSVDRFDTWKDFVANTSGAFIVWFVYRAVLLISNKKS